MSYVLIRALNSLWLLTFRTGPCARKNFLKFERKLHYTELFITENVCVLLGTGAEDEDGKDEKAQAHTWSRTVRCFGWWKGWRCRSAGETGKQTSSWSCCLSWSWRPVARHCRTSRRRPASSRNHLVAFVWRI